MPSINKHISYAYPYLSPPPPLAPNPHFNPPSDHGPNLPPPAKQPALAPRAPTLPSPNVPHPGTPPQANAPVTPTPGSYPWTPPGPRPPPAHPPVGPTLPPSSPTTSPPPLPPVNPPTSPPGNPPTVIVVVFVSLGGLFFLAFLAAGLLCWVKKKKELIEEAEVVDVQEHIRVHEDVVVGPHGEAMVVKTIDEDIEIREEVVKVEEVVGHGACSSELGRHHHGHATAGSHPGNTTAHLLND